jgi:hypothetical protein
VLAGGSEFQSASRREVADGGGDEDFSGAGECGYTRADVDGDATDVDASLLGPRSAMSLGRPTAE